MQRQTKGLASVTLALLMLFAPDAFAASQRTFVASFGSDSNPCSLAAPCRGFQAAVDAVAAGGEVVTLDSGGFGTMIIGKAIQIIVPPGMHAAIFPESGAAAHL